MFCDASPNIDGWGNPIGTCVRGRVREVNGRMLCWLHAERVVETTGLDLDYYRRASQPKPEPPKTYRKTRKSRRGKKSR